MEYYESNCNLFWLILGSWLSNINKLMWLWYYGIFLPKEEEKKEEEEK